MNYQRGWRSFGWLACVVTALCSIHTPKAQSNEFRVGAAAVNIPADDSLVIGGGIGPGKATGQEGELRAVATVMSLRKEGADTKVAIIAVDVLMMNRDLLDQSAKDIENKLGIPFQNVLINCTHTHHAPTTCTVHGYSREEGFCKTVQNAIVQATEKAHANLAPARFDFALGEESSVGQNSRLLLADQTIFWVGSREDAVRPTGPFDPQLPVLAFRGEKEKLISLWFNHSTHTIGTRNGAVRSPSFYGLAAQELEADLGGIVGFLEGASGSTHNLNVKSDECVVRIKLAVRSALRVANPQPVTQLASIKREFTFNVRKFDETVEHAKVTSYCKTRTPQYADGTIEVFRKQRDVLSPHQGEERKSWIQVIRIGDVAIVGVPAEFFTRLGMEIKRRSPFRYTYVAELANDWIGYLPDREGHEAGGYQTWTGLHSYAEPGTGEFVVDEAVSILNEMAATDKNR